MINKKRPGERKWRKTAAVRHEQTKVPNEGIAENVKSEGRVVGKTGFTIDIDLKKYEKKKKGLSREW